MPACRARGLLTWFPVHCTSMNNTNRLISGDSKGAAEQFAEHWGRRQEKGFAKGFVAAFAQSNVGDTSPNTGGAFCLDTGARGSSQQPVCAAWIMHPVGTALLRLCQYMHAAMPSIQNSTVYKMCHDTQGAACCLLLNGLPAPSTAWHPLLLLCLRSSSSSPPASGHPPYTHTPAATSAGKPCDAATSTCNGRNEMCHGRGPSWPDDTNSTFTIGMRQARKGIELLKSATEELSGAVDFRCVRACGVVGGVLVRLLVRLLGAAGVVT